MGRYFALVALVLLVLALVLYPTAPLFDGRPDLRWIPSAVCLGAAGAVLVVGVVVRVVQSARRHG